MELRHPDHVRQDRRGAGGIDEGIGAHRRAEIAGFAPVQFAERLQQIDLGRVERGPGPQRQRPFAPFRGKIEGDDVRHSAIHQPQDHAKPDRPAAEDHDLVARLDFRPVDAVHGHRQRFAHGGNVEIDTVRDGQQVHAGFRLAHQQFLGKGAFRPAAADVRWRHHRVDDDRIAHLHARYFSTDTQHLARAFMAERGFGAGRGDAADLDVGQVRPADAAGLHLHDHVLRPGFGQGVVIQPDVVDAMDLQQLHRLSPALPAPLRGGSCSRRRCRSSGRSGTTRSPSTGRHRSLQSPRARPAASPGSAGHRRWSGTAPPDRWDRPSSA